MMNFSTPEREPLVDQPRRGGTAQIDSSGLEQLRQIDRIIFRRTIENAGDYCICDTKIKRFSLCDARENILFSATEEIECCTREFNMDIVDNQRNEVIHVYRHAGSIPCCCCCLPSAPQTIEMYSPPGTRLGIVQQEYSMFTPKFVIKDASGESVLYVVAERYAAINPYGEYVFTVTEANSGEVVGKIECKATDLFTLSYGIALDVRLKVLLIGAFFLIDFLYLEPESNTNKSNDCCDDGCDDSLCDCDYNSD